MRSLFRPASVIPWRDSFLMSNREAVIIDTSCFKDYRYIFCLSTDWINPSSEVAPEDPYQSVITWHKSWNFSALKCKFVYISCNFILLEKL